MYMYPLVKEIRLQIIATVWIPDRISSTIFRISRDPIRDWDQNLFEIMAVVSILSLISSARGQAHVYICVYIHV